MNNDLETKLKELKQGYVIKLRGILLELNSLVSVLQVDIQEIYSKIHTVSGTSGMYGLSEISEMSTELEFYLKPLRENPGSIDKEELEDKIRKYINQVEEMLAVGE